MPQSGKLVVISGPSGVGKTTVVNRLLETPGLTRSISATTRAPRPGEKDGKDYSFTSRERFEEEIRRGGFLEHAEINGHLYGTPLRGIEEAVAAGKIVILAIDVQGAAALRRMKRPFLGIFLMPPSVEELQRRLAGRRDTPEPEMRRRLERARQEMEGRGAYDAVVTNDSVEGAVADILKIFRERRFI